MWSYAALLLAAFVTVAAKNDSSVPRPVTLDLSTLRLAVHALQQPDSGTKLLMVPLVTAAQSIIQVWNTLRVARSAACRARAARSRFVVNCNLAKVARSFATLRYAAVSDASRNRARVCLSAGGARRTLQHRGCERDSRGLVRGPFVRTTRSRARAKHRTQPP